jgi:beta-aspartyl-peptidase (threonine type)
MPYSLTLFKSLGAVIPGRHFLNPVSLSKIIMYESLHCALSGDGALEFAQKREFPICEPDELISELAREKVNVSYENYLDYVKYYYEGKPLGEETHDTVSAVAMDANGHLACAMSTGTCKSLSFGLQNICFQKSYNNLMNQRNSY